MLHFFGEHMSHPSLLRALLLLRDYSHSLLFVPTVDADARCCAALLIILELRDHMTGKAGVNTAKCKLAGTMIVALFFFSLAIQNYYLQL